MTRDATVYRAFGVDDWVGVRQVERTCYRDEGWSDDFLRMAPELFGALSVVARTGDEVVGYCIAGRCESPHDRVWILGVAVLPSHRGEGIGRALVAESLARIRTTVAREVRLTVDAGNARARRLYEGLGFVAQECVTAFFGEGRDRLVYVARL